MENIEKLFKELYGAIKEDKMEQLSLRVVYKHSHTPLLEPYECTYKVWLVDDKNTPELELKISQIFSMILKKVAGHYDRESLITPYFGSDYIETIDLMMLRKDEGFIRSCHKFSLTELHALRVVELEKAKKKEKEERERKIREEALEEEAEEILEKLKWRVLLSLRDSEEKDIQECLKKLLEEEI